MRTSLNLPSEIIEEILCRLPAKSLGRFRCVSKPWKTLISKPQFIKAHLNHSSRGHPQKTLGSYGETFYSIDVVLAAEATELRFLPLEILWDGIAGLCNGILLARGTKHSLFLINPTTREYSKGFRPRNVPDEPHFDHREVSGLGYDSKNDDYKVVEISYSSVENAEGVSVRDTRVTVYSLRNKTLREVIVPPNDNFNDECESKIGIYLNGCLHWLSNRICSESSDCSWFIAAFNLNNDEFEEVQLPSSLRDDISGNAKILAAVNGSLCLSVKWVYDDVMDIWVMMDYGVIESWKRIPIHGLWCMYSVRPMCFIGDQEVVLQLDWSTLVAYNVEDETSRDVEVRGLPSWFNICGTFVESLVSPKHAIGLREDHEGSEVSPT